MKGRADATSQPERKCQSPENARVPVRITATPDGQELLKVTGPQLELIQAAAARK